MNINRMMKKINYCLKQIYKKMNINRMMKKIKYCHKQIYNKI